MAQNTLTEEQRLTLLEWLAADFPTGGIKARFRERGWPVITDNLLRYYRRTYFPDIMALREARRSDALTRGYALKEARVAALNAHAEALETILWVPGRNGRLYNEKAWRETLDDIAKEMGERPQKTEVSGPDGAPLFGPAAVAAARQELAAAKEAGDAGH